MTRVKMPVALIATFLWIGFVCAISFLEAWIKFRAPGVSVAIGLGIGRLVFGALNKVEWVFALTIIGNILFSNTKLVSKRNLLYYLPLLLLIAQTLWLLPMLDERAEMHIQGQIVPASNLHFYYVGIEIVKIVCLSIFGLGLFKSITNEKEYAHPQQATNENFSLTNNA